MNIKTTRELAFFLAGIDAGRIFKVYDGCNTSDHIYLEDYDSENRIVVCLRFGGIYFEDHDLEGDAYMNDYRHYALRGILESAHDSAKRCVKWHREETAKRAAGGAES